MKKHYRSVALAASALAIAMSMGGSALAWEQGGYVYNRGEDRFVDNVYNFLKHFNYEQYYWAEAFEFTTANNSYVDAMDFAYYSGHGNNYYLGMGPGASVAGVDLDADAYARWGDSDLEFIVFQSCTVIPSAADRADWADAWVPNGVFQGLHQAIGYRTLSYSGNGISNNFGDRISDGEGVWQAWFAAVNDERSWWRGRDYPGLASAVMHPSTQNDTHFNFVADPPAGHTALTNWYQHW